jgi:hypothetical protein
MGKGKQGDWYGQDRTVKRNLGGVRQGQSLMASRQLSSWPRAGNRQVTGASLPLHGRRVVLREDAMAWTWTKLQRQTQTRLD